MGKYILVLAIFCCGLTACQDTSKDWWDFYDRRLRPTKFLYRAFYDTPAWELAKAADGGIHCVCANFCRMPRLF